jgi:hypothetical protein
LSAWPAIGAEHGVVTHIHDQLPNSGCWPQQYCDIGQSVSEPADVSQ